MLVLSGCMAAAGDTDATPSPSLTNDAKQGQGRIEGRVTDPELRPIPKARLQLTSRDAPTASMESESDGEGVFTFEGLAGGEYLIYAAKLGYRDAAPLRVTVSEAEPAPAAVVLEPLPTLEAFHRTEHYTVYFYWYACAIAANTPYCPLLVYTSSNTTRAYKNEEREVGEMQTFVVEMSWKPNFSQCGGAMRSDIYSPEADAIGTAASRADTNPYHWDNVPDRVKSPTHVLIPREGDDPIAMHSSNRTELNDGTPIETDGKWSIIAFPHGGGSTLGTPVDYQCTVDQRVNIHLTGFYNEPAPTKEWSALA